VLPDIYICADCFPGQQPWILPGCLNRVPASASVKAGNSLVLSRSSEAIFTKCYIRYRLLYFNLLLSYEVASYVTFYSILWLMQLLCYVIIADRRGAVPAWAALALRYSVITRLQK